MNICTQISEELYDNYKQTFINKDVAVLFEKVEDGYSFGHTSEYLPILVKGDYPKSSFKVVEIKEFKDHQLFGVVK